MSYQDRLGTNVRKTQNEGRFTHRTSPALLSWYVCDDCPCGGDAGSDAKRHALAYVYDLIKQRDPYHITSGAGGCGNMYSLGEPYALSLDMIMYENYDPEPHDHFGGGSWATGKGLDGGYRHYPIAFEPLCNLQGFYSTTPHHTIIEQNRTDHRMRCVCCCCDAISLISI